MKTYRRIVIGRHGGPEVLALAEAPLPEPRAGEVRIAVAVAGVAFADVLMREGVYPGAPKPPFTPGYDIAGRVDALGPGVSGLCVGERVVALTKVGGYADYACVPAAAVVPIVGEVGDDEAVALVLNFLTAYQLLHRCRRVRAGERVLIHGAGGGVGDALLQLGRLASLELYGTASGGKHATLAAYGATLIDYRREDFLERIRSLTDDGVDAVFDAVGGGQWRRSYACLRPGGMLVGYGFSAALLRGRLSRWRALKGWLGMPRFQLLGLMSANRAVAGFDISVSQRVHPEAYREDLARLLALLAEGQVKPRIAARFPLAEAAKAQQLLGSGEVVGKIVLLAGARAS